MDVAQSVGRTPAQVLIRWSIQNNVVTIPKSTKKERVKENSQVIKSLKKKIKKKIKVHFLPVES